MQIPIRRVLAVAGGCAVAFSPLLLSGTGDAATLAQMTYYVSGHGRDSYSGSSCTTGFATIAHAISVAGRGDTIVVCPDARPYAQGDIVVPPGKNLTIEGKGRPVINAATDDNGITVESDGTTIEGLTIENAADAGIEADGVSYGTISHNELRDNTIGILILGSSDVDVLANISDDNAQAGIVLTDSAGVMPVGKSLTPDALVVTCAHNVVSENITDDNGGQGILLVGFDAAPSGVFDNKVISNTTDSNGFDISALYSPAGILLTDGSGVGNVFDNLIASNEAQYNAGPGISLIAGAAAVAKGARIEPDAKPGDLNGNVITTNVLGVNNVGGAVADGTRTAGPDLKMAAADTETTGILVSSPLPLVASVYDNLINGDFYGIWATNTVGPKLLFFNNVFLGVVVPVFIA